MSLPITGPTTLAQADQQILQCSLRCSVLEFENSLGGLRNKDVTELAQAVSRIACWYLTDAPNEISPLLNPLRERVTGLKSVIAELNGSLPPPPTTDFGHGRLSKRAVVVRNLHLLDGLLK